MAMLVKTFQYCERGFFRGADTLGVSWGLHFFHVEAVGGGPVGVGRHGRLALAFDKDFGGG